MMERAGVKVSLVAGAHKVDGNPYEPLPTDVRNDLQAEVDDLRLGLANDIAAGRGDRLTAEAALKGEFRGRYWAARPEDDRSVERIGWIDRERSLTPEGLKYWIRAHHSGRARSPEL